MASAGALAGPLASNAQSAEHGPCTVCHDELPVVAGDVADRVHYPGRAKGTDLGTGGPEMLPELPGGAHGAEPII
jgi:hypothetical protein